MKKELITATAVAALLAGTSFASAQRGPENSPSSANPAPSASPASPAAPAEKIAPNGMSGSGMNTPGARANDDKAQGSTPQQNRAQTQGGTSPSQAQAPAQSPPSGQAQTPSQRQPSQAQTPSTDRNASSNPQTNVNVNLTADQRSRIRETVVRQSNAPRIGRSEVNFNLSVGTVVPRTVRVVALPAAVIEIHPAWRGYSYILVGEEIVVVEPGSLRIVAIIPA